MKVTVESKPFFAAPLVVTFISSFTLKLSRAKAEATSQLLLISGTKI